MSDKIVNHFVLADGSVAQYDYSALAGAPDYESQIALLDKNVYKDFAISPSQTVNGWKLTGDGACTSDSNSRLKKYGVTAGIFLHLKLSKDNAGVYQWQSAESVPGSLPNNNLVGEPVTYGVDGVVQVPPGATRLIISESTSNTTNSVSLTQDVLNTEFLNSQFIALESGNFVELSTSNYMVKQANASRLRSVQPVPVAGWSSITAPTGYVMWFYCYDENFTFLGAPFGVWKQTVSPSELIDGTAYVNIIIKDASNNTADLTGLVETVQDGIVVTSYKQSNSDTMVMLYNHYGSGLTISQSGCVSFIGGLIVYLGNGNYYDISSRNGKEFQLLGSGGLSQTLIIDGSVANLNANTDADAVDVFKIVDRHSYTTNDVPIANARSSEGNPNNTFPSAPFIRFFVSSNEFNNKNLKLAQYKEDYYPYTMRNSGSGWTSRVNLLHITDTHIGETVSYNNLLESIDVGNDLFAGGIIKAVINTGDNTNGGGSSLSNFLAQYTKNTAAISTSTAPYLMQLGNHDANNGETVAIADVPTKSDLFPPFQNIFAQTGVVAGDATNQERYYYYDVTQGGHSIRIIMLDMLDHPDYTANNTNYHCQWNVVYSQDQIDWLANTALDVPADYGVIICNHFPFAPHRDAGYSEIYPALNDGYFVQSATGSASGGWLMIPEIVQAWQNRTTISKTYADTTGDQDIVANYDFSDVPASAEFICYLVGHTHSKNVFRVEEENGVRFNQLMMCEDSSGQNGVALNRTYKRFGTISDNAFSCLAIDMIEKKIYRTSYGVYEKCSDVDVKQTQVFDYNLT